eukprot:226537_1
MNILPVNAHEITDAFLSTLGDDKDETVYINDNKKPSAEEEETTKTKPSSKSPKEDESEENELDFELYDSDQEESGENTQQIQTHLDTHKQSSNLENNDTHITTATSSDDNTSPNITTNTKAHDIEEVKHDFNALKVSSNATSHDLKKDEIIVRDDEDTKEPFKSSSKGSKAHDVGSRTMEQWLNRDNLIVHPVWIGNLPRGTTVNQLRHFVESQVGRVLVSIHISVKQQNNERTYAFLNLPTAEKQLLAVTLLDGKIFTEEKLIVRPKRPSKFPQSFFGSSPISEHFKHFRDCVVPAILANPTINLNVTSVRKILEQNHINIDHLPNRVWCVQCTLVPQCHRTYCSFYHCHQEKELGRIISILAAQDSSLEDDAFNSEHRKNLELANNPNTIRSRHTLLIQGLPRSITSKKIEETFEVFGEIDNVIVNPDHTCYVRMKRSQDARKIVHLFKYNHAGVIVDFAPYGAAKERLSQGGSKRSGGGEKLPPARPKIKNCATEPSHTTYSKQTPNLVNNRSLDGRMNGNNPNVPSLPVTNPKYSSLPDPRPRLQNAQTVNSMNYGYNNNNMAAYSGSGNTYNANMNNKASTARNSLRLNKTHSEPIPNQYAAPNQNPMWNNTNNMNAMSGRWNNSGVGGVHPTQFNQQNNPQMNQMNAMMSQMTPQQYTEYYQQMQQQWYRSSQNQNQSFNNSNQFNNQFNQPQVNRFSGGYSGYAPNAYSQQPTQYNPLSPIAQTPQHLGNMNGLSPPVLTSPPVTSPRVISPPASAASYNTNLVPARNQLKMRNCFSTGDAYTANHATSNAASNPSYPDDNMTRSQQTYYQNQMQNTYSPSNYDAIIQQHHTKNAQYQKWMAQQPPPPPPPNPSQFPFKTTTKPKKQPAQERRVIHDGSVPGAPQMATSTIPEPDLHFDIGLSPLSPTSALKKD